MAELIQNRHMDSENDKMIRNRLYSSKPAKKSGVPTVSS